MFSKKHLCHMFLENVFKRTVPGPRHVQLLYQVAYRTLLTKDRNFREPIVSSCFEINGTSILFTTMKSLLFGSKDGVL